MILTNFWAEFSDQKQLYSDKSFFSYKKYFQFTLVMDSVKAHLKFVVDLCMINGIMTNNSFLAPSRKTIKGMRYVCINKQLKKLKITTNLQCKRLRC